MAQQIALPQPDELLERPTVAGLRLQDEILTEKTFAGVSHSLIPKRPETGRVQG